MSRKALIKTLELLEKKIEKSSQAFRNLVSDKKAHSIKIDSQDLKEQVKNELLSREGFDKLPDTIMKIIDEEVPQMVATLYNQMRPENFNQNLRRAYITSDLIGNNKSFIVLLATKSETSNRSVFAYFRRLKQVAQRPLIKRLNSQIKKLNSGNKSVQRDEIKSSAFLDIGHEESSAVSKQRKRIIEQALWDFQPASKEASAFIATLADEVSFNITKNPGEPIDVIDISLESKALNRGVQAKAEKEAAGQLNKALLEAVTKLEGKYWANAEGSDSKVQRMQKSVLNEFSQDKFRSKNVRSNIKNNKINKTSKASSKKRKVRGKKQPTVQDDKRVILESFQERNQDLLSLQALLNAKLPTEIRKNMGYPRLENRTGRFADSVRVTDISRTRKGFPSIGYTYQRQPYQVFEQGAGKAPWSNERRDPRSLINTTIREIASEILIGRFFTRRI